MRRPALKVIGLASFLVLGLAALTNAQQGPPGTMRGSDSPPVEPVLSPALKDVPPQTELSTDPRHVINLELPHPAVQGDRPVRPDGALQSRFGLTAPTPTGVNFDGVGANGFAPPDNDGSVGPNHYIQWINVQFAIYDKAGTKLYGPAGSNTFSGAGPGVALRHPQRWRPNRQVRPAGGPLGPDPVRRGAPHPCSLTSV